MTRVSNHVPFVHQGSEALRSFLCLLFLVQPIIAKHAAGQDPQTERHTQNARDQRDSQGAQVQDSQTNTAPAHRLSNEEHARELFYRGDRLYSEGNYEEALRAFEESYRLTERPELLFNMANVLERLGRHEEALQNLKQFLPHAPENMQGTVRKRIHALEARVDRAPRPPFASGAQEATVQERGTSTIPTETTFAAVEQAEESGSVLPYLALGTGALALAGGTYFAIAAGKEHDRGGQQCREGLCPQSAKTALERETRNALLADVGWTIGIVGLAVGLVWLLTADEDSPNALQVGSSRDGGTVGWRSRF